MSARDEAFEAWRLRAAEADILDVALGGKVGAKLKKRGAEHIGPCPACGGTDRFAVRPAKRIFICRGAAGGDVISMVMHACAVPFLAACEIINGEPPPQKGSQITEETRARAEQLKAEALARNARREADENAYRERERRTTYDIWNRAHPLEGSSAALYLELRGLQLPETNGRAPRLRCVESMPFFVGKEQVIHRGPAMVAPIVDSSGKYRGLHFTWLDLAEPKGKARLEHQGEALNAKKARGSKQGNRIELLGAPDPRRLVLGEGIEKLIAVAMALQVPEHRGELANVDQLITAYWSAADLGNLAGKAKGTVAHPTQKSDKGRPIKVPGPVPDLEAPAIEIPDSVTELVLLGDTTSDPVITELAIARAAARYARPGRTVRVAWAPEGADFDDLLREARGDQAATAAALARIAGLVDSAPIVEGTVRDGAGEAGTAEADNQRAPVAGAPNGSPAASGARARLLPAAGASGVPPDAPAPRSLSAATAESRSSETSRAGVFGGKVPPEKGGGGAGGDELNRKLAWLPQTDLGNVERFVARWGHVLKWCLATGWHYWDGKRWSRKGADTFVLRAEHATVRAIQDEAKAISAEAATIVPLLEPPREGEPADKKVVKLDAVRAKKKADKETAKARRERAASLNDLAKSLRQWGRKSETANKMSLAKRARADMEVHHEEFDADPWKINVTNGTLVVRRPAELEGGEPLIVLKPHDPADLITKISPVEYKPDAECPLFDAFFLRVQPEQRQRRFLMQWHGYSLTGDAEEQKLAIYFGSGRNGKGTLMETCAFVAGDYAESVGIDTFLQSSLQKSGGQATPDLAKLPGVRYLRTGEPDKAAKLNEALIKRVTGGDPIDARNLNKDFFTFFAQFKLSIACNHRPKIGGTDEGIWARVILVPWLVHIPDTERDMQLKAKLRAEASGILNRLLDGLRDYLEHGLVLGEEIAAATAKYRRDSDAVGRFMEACTVADEKAKTQSSLLWETYLAWAKCNDGPNYSNKGFSGILEDRGYRKIQDNVMVWVGVRLTKSVSDFVDHEGKPLRFNTADAAAKPKADDDDPVF